FLLFGRLHLDVSIIVTGAFLIGLYSIKRMLCQLFRKINFLINQYITKPNQKNPRQSSRKCYLWWRPVTFSGRGSVTAVVTVTPARMTAPPQRLPLRRGIPKRWGRSHRLLRGIPSLRASTVPVIAGSVSSPKGTKYSSSDKE